MIALGLTQHTSTCYTVTMKIIRGLGILAVSLALSWTLLRALVLD